MNADPRRPDLVQPFKSPVNNPNLDFSEDLKGSQEDLDYDGTAQFFITALSMMGLLMRWKMASYGALVLALHSFANSRNSDTSRTLGSGIPMAIMGIIMSYMQYYTGVPVKPSTST